MRITKLSLTNFRSFSETQCIDFAPVTLLFGPNSVGKSTVLLALFYLQQILEKGQCDPLRIEALGDKYVGGFKNLVNGRDLRKSITLKVEYAKPDDIGAGYAHLAELEGWSDLFLGGVTEIADKVAVELQVSWSESAKSAYVSSYRLWLDGEECAEAASDSGLKQPMIMALNYHHSNLLGEEYDDWIKEQLEQGQAVHPDYQEEVARIKGWSEDQEGGWQEFLTGEVAEADDAIVFSEDCFISKFHALLNESRIPESEYNNSSYMTAIGDSDYTLSHAPIGFKGFAGALPRLGRRLHTSLDLEDERTGVIVSEILSDVLVAPLDNLLKILNDSLCIGPLRNIPDPTYQANPYPQAKDWHNGMAAWDVLEKSDAKLLKAVHHWMADKDKLDLGYGLALKVEKRYAELKSAGKLQAYERIEDQLEAMIGRSSSSESSQIRFDETSTRYSYRIWDQANHIDVMPNEIGVGVSQLLPIVVAALDRRKGVVAVEQPELHIHPRVQVAVGDLFTQVKSDVSFLVETHSEHLILRLLKRIRQTTDGELPEGYKAISPSHVSIVYLESSSDGVKVRRIEIDSDGEFVGRWPNGFFAERAEELF